MKAWENVLAIPVKGRSTKRETETAGQIGRKRQPRKRACSKRPKKPSTGY